MKILYGSAFSSAGTYLLLLALSDIPPVIGLTVACAFFNGIGKTRLTLAVSVVGAGVLFVAAPLLGIVLDLGVYGLIYAQLIASAVTGRRRPLLRFTIPGATVDLGQSYPSSARPSLACLSLVLLSLLALPNVLAIVADALVFLLVYFTSAPLLGAIDAADVEIARMPPSEG